MELLTKECTGCMACYNKCPNKAISITYNEIGCYIPKIDETKCTNCNLCNLVCPQLKKIEEKETPKTCYAIMGKDEIRKNSASGGLFATIAKEYLKNGNYVCGAVFSSDFKQVNHEIINKEEDLIRIQNSKYVQSNMGNILKEIKNLLDKNKEVLFGGTPCQVAGLKSYLEKEYVNLLTIDIICHGNPSPLVWEKYVSEITKNKPLSNVLFRNKKNGWHYSGEVEFCFKNNFFKQKIKDKLFYKSFFGHLILNEACYNCKYTNLHRPADVTIGDFWGIEQYDSDMDDKKGTSVAIIHTKKGQEIFDKYNDKFHKIKEFDIEVAISGNNRLESPSKRNYDTKNFCKNLHSMPVIKNLKKELSPKYEGIIKNLWETTNFGASLSAWALQQYLFQKGKNYHILKRYQPAPYTYEFGNKHLKTTHVVSSEEEYKQLNKNCDNFIIGTDQVLRPIIIEKTIDKDLLGYTSFNKKRIAFSASFGMKYLEKMSWTNRIKYKKLIKRFDAFSTRESSGVDICKKEFNTKSQHIIDPVFFINQDDWSKLISDSGEKYKGKIVYYALLLNEETQKLKEYIEQKCNKEVVMLVNKEMPITEFISAIKNSDALLTSSFHGTCFALIFNKKVLAITNDSLGDSRFSSLIETFNIEKQTVENINDVYKRDELFIEYDHNKIASIIKKEREKADLWFETNINCKKTYSIKKIIAELDYKLFIFIEKILKFIEREYNYHRLFSLCNNPNKKVLLWGASLYLGELLDKYPKIAKNILGIIDANPKLHNNKFHGCMVYPPEKIIELEPNYIISMVKNNHQGAHNAIKNYLKKQKLEEKLLPDLFM